MIWFVTILVLVAIWLWWEYSYTAIRWRQDRHYTQRLDRARVLTRSYIESLPDDRLVGAVHDHVLAAIEDGDGWQDNHDVEIVQRLAKGMQYVWATLLVEGEVGNGGFVQLFCNSSRQLVPLAIEGYRAFGLLKPAKALESALLVYQKAVPKQTKTSAPIEAWDWLGAHPKIGQQIEEREAGFEPTAEYNRAREHYIREHLDEFTSDARVTTKREG